MPRRLPRPARLWLTAVKLLAVGSIVVTGLSATPEDPPRPGYAAEQVREVGDTPSREARLLARHDCSRTGFAGATPLSAVVRTARGHLRHVSFDAGWAVYSAHGPARLVAVCLDEAPAQP